MKIGSYKLVNADKVERAIHGTVGSRGETKGGVGEDADASEILAEYDRLGGLIKKDGKYRVKTGSFYDIKGKKPHAKPKPILLFSVDGEIVEVDANKELPLEVKASEMVKERRETKAAAKREATKDSKGKKAAAKKSKAKADKDEEGDEDEEDTDDEEVDEDEEEGELA